MRILLLLALLISATLPAAAQEDDRSAVRVQIKDGKIIVNGQVIDTASSDRIEIETDDGESITVFVDRDGNRVWVGDREPRDFPALNAFFPRGPDGEFRFRSDDDDPMVFLEENLQSGLRRLEHAPLAQMRNRLNPEAMRMERRLHELARRVRQAEGEERQDLEAELDELLEEAFEVRLEAERAHAEELRERLADIETRLQERSAARSKIIERRKRQLLGERHLLDW